MKSWKIALLITTIVTLIICGGGVLYASILKPVEPPKTLIPLNADTIFRLVNNERTKAGLKPLVRDARLDATAQARADDMVARNYFAHRDPITNENMVKPKPYCSKTSENIVWIKYETPQEDNQEAVDWWMNSKSHREAILLPEYTNAGIGITNKRIVYHFCIAK